MPLGDPDCPGWLSNLGCFLPRCVMVRKGPTYPARIVRKMLRLSFAAGAGSPPPILDAATTTQVSPASFQYAGARPSCSLRQLVRRAAPFKARSQGARAREGLPAPRISARVRASSALPATAAWIAAAISTIRATFAAGLRSRVAPISSLNISSAASIASTARAFGVFMLDCSTMSNVESKLTSLR
jgi:hypothetical protein